MAAAAIVDIASRATSPKKQPLPKDERLYWRAVVHAGGTFAASREGDRVEWHLAGCDAPAAEGSHCSNGAGMVDLVGHPDGHCMVDGVCGRCGERAAAPLRKAA